MPIDAALHCYCGSQQLFSTCCEPYIKNLQKPPTAEALMRSRFSAYVVQAFDYILQTTHSSTRNQYSKEALLEWTAGIQWQFLTVLSASERVVTFKAYYYETSAILQVHHERSYFAQEDGFWYYVSGDHLPD